LIFSMNPLGCCCLSSGTIFNGK